MSTIAPIHLNSNGAAAAARQNSPSSGGFEQFLPAANDRDANAAGGFLPGGVSSGGVVSSGQLPPDAPPYERGGPPADGMPYEPLPPPLGGLPYEPTTLPADGLPYQHERPPADGTPYQPSLPPADGLPYDRAGLPADGIPYQPSTPPADGALAGGISGYQSASDSAGQEFLQQTVAQALDRLVGAFASAETAIAGDGAPSASDLMLANRLWAESQAASAARSIREKTSDLALQTELR